MSEARIPYGGSLPVEGLLDELTATITYNEANDALTMTFCVRPKPGYREPTLRLVTGLFPHLIAQLKALDPQAIDQTDSLRS